MFQAVQMVTNAKAEEIKASQCGERYIMDEAIVVHEMELFPSYVRGSHTAVVPRALLEML